LRINNIHNTSYSWNSRILHPSKITTYKVYISKIWFTYSISTMHCIALYHILQLTLISIHQMHLNMHNKMSNIVPILSVLISVCFQLSSTIIYCSSDQIFCNRWWVMITTNKKTLSQLSILKAQRQLACLSQAVKTIMSLTASLVKPKPTGGQPCVFGKCSC